MIEYQTYVINYDPNDLRIAMTTVNNPPFLYPYHGDFLLFGRRIEDFNWESGVDQIMEKYNEAWRNLAQF